MKRVHEWDEPWKKKEPGSRLSSRAVKDQRAIEKQRHEMDLAATQHVVFVCHKELLLPGLFKSFTVKIKNPLRYEEIKKRVMLAFPELHWEES